ncbi:MAG: hypothetical protein WKF84_22280 [Pyrinomonadaceae bacterium]
MSSEGFDEAINFSFIDAAADGTIELIPALRSSSASSNNAELVSVANPIVEGSTRMRPTLVPGLLDAVRRNFDHGIKDVTLYEIGRVFSVGEPKPLELDALALVATGGLLRANRAGAERELDFYDLKGAVELAVEALRVPTLKFEAARLRHLRDGQSASIWMGGTQIGAIGRLGDNLAAVYKFRQPIYVCEVDLSALEAISIAPVRYHPLGRYPRCFAICRWC